MQKSIIRNKFPEECQNKTKNRWNFYYHQGEFPDLGYKYYIEESFAIDGATQKVVPRLGSALTDPVYVRPEDFNKWLDREKQAAQDFLQLLSEAGFDSKEWKVEAQNHYHDYKYKHNFRLQHKEDATRFINIREDIETKGSKKHPITKTRYRIKASTPYAFGEERRVIYDDFWIQSYNSDYARFNFRCEKNELKETLVALKDQLDNAGERYNLKTMTEIEALERHGVMKCNNFADPKDAYCSYYYSEEHANYQFVRTKWFGKDPFEGQLLWSSDDPNVYCEIDLRQLTNYKSFSESEYRYAAEKEGLTFHAPGKEWNIPGVRFKLPDTKEECTELKQTVAMAEVAMRDTLYEIDKMPKKERHEFREKLKKAQETTQLDLSDLNQLTQGQER